MRPLRDERVAVNETGLGLGFEGRKLKDGCEQGVGGRFMRELR